MSSPVAFRTLVPAHAGGVDLSIKNTFQTVLTMVPAHAGGVDLSQQIGLYEHGKDGPRPCGRGGFKLDQWTKIIVCGESPPVCCKLIIPS